MPRRISLSDIAKASGYHRSTVSLALRDPRGINSETRQLIKDLAETLGYRPDPVLQQMARQRWRKERAPLQECLAYISHKQWNPAGIESQLAPVAAKHAEKFGYRLEEINTTPETSASTLKRVIRARGIRGVLFHGFRYKEIPPSFNLDWNELTGVCFSVGRLRPPIHTVNFDAFMGARVAFSKAREAGYQRIGAALFSHRPATEDDFARKGGILCEQFDLPEENRLPLLTCDFEDREAFEKWYEKCEPDCVIGFTNGPLKWLRSMGLKAPEDVGFASLGVARGSETAGVVKDFGELVESAIELLATEIRENNTGVPRTLKYTLIEPQWCEGSTLRKKA